MPHVKIYSRDHCPYCVRAKQLLTKKGVNFEEIDLTGREADLRDLINRTGMRTVPQIFIGDKLVGGYTDLAALDARGELDGMLSD